jgi:hypothetical protein
MGHLGVTGRNNNHVVNVESSAARTLQCGLQYTVAALLNPADSRVEDWRGARRFSLSVAPRGPTMFRLARGRSNFPLRNHRHSER